MSAWGALPVLAAGLIATVALAGYGSTQARDGTVRSERDTVDVQVLALNDFHGNLQPPAGTVATDDGVAVAAGGVEYLDTHIGRLRAENRHTTVVSAGDLIGASPLLSALFHDEPTIEAMNELGLDLNAVGNHEFDEGTAELERMQRGGCHTTDGCQGGDGFGGADFGFLGANVIRASRRGAGTGERLFPPYAIRSFEGERVAFVGMTLEATPSVVTPSAVAGLEFRDEARTVNRLIPGLRRRGAETVIVLIHEGGAQTAGNRANSCDGLSGPIVEIVERTSAEADLFVTGHTHNPYNCVVDGRPVTSADDSGRLVTDIDLRIDRDSGEPVEITVDNVVISRDVAPAPAQSALVKRYLALAAPIGNRVIGEITADVTRSANEAGESALGDLIADAQLAATGAGTGGAAQIALINPGGIRADLAHAAADANDAGEGAGGVTYEEAFAAQPFGNNLVTMSLTGAQIERLLEQQWLGQPVARILQVSDGFSYVWDPRAPVGARVDPASILLFGTPLDPPTSYRVTVNSFLAEGGDNFSVLREGTERRGGPLDLDALEAYFEAGSPLAPGPPDRIRLP